jgi:enediyne biosynthesis protein E4
MLIVLPALLSCNKKETGFKQIKAGESGITFNNEIKEDAELNILRYEYIYNGGGVGIGDFNNDSLPDVYFTGNLVPNKLYLNKGNFKFEDVTESTKTGGNGRWSKGVSVVDINNDGLQDIYVSCAVLFPVTDRKNLLYINKGADKKTGIPVFEEKAEAYGLADSSSTHMSAFFDYDNDGDLDVYLVVNELDGTNQTDFRPIIKNGTWPNTDKLLRNDWNDTLGHPVFTDVSAKAGILVEGYGLGINIVDINKDGWKDIFVTNDYISNNHFYINNRNGTFTDRNGEYFKHTSRNAMGNDVADINNDGLADIIELDMAPADNYRLKMINNPINYQTLQLSDRFGYTYQYPRNCLHLNLGAINNSTDSGNKKPLFTEVGYYAGIAHTDWSWGVLASDIDNDGLKDLMITNGLPKDLSDMDFMAYRSEAVSRTHPLDMLQKMPEAKISNYIYKNNGDVSFVDKTTDWGWQLPTFSAGVATADFDRDGDLDVVINNINMEAGLYENKTTEGNNFLQLQLKGSKANINGLGTNISIYYDSAIQSYEHTPYRGYMSSIENIIHFGIGKNNKIDSVVINWGNGLTQTLKNVTPNQKLIIDIKDAQAKNDAISIQTLPWFTATSLINHFSKERDFIDFNIQRMLPHKLSSAGPAAAAGDINGDGLDDVIIGGSAPHFASAFIQDENGRFKIKQITDTNQTKLTDDAAICLFDADNDNDLDIYIASGGCEIPPLSSDYKDHFYINDGKGNFKEDTAAFVINTASKSCAKAADYDMDGDLDLFIGGRAKPGSYPTAVSSYIYRNESKNGVIKFVDITKDIAPDLIDVGMIGDAIWSDVNNDAYPDLLLAGEWMPLTILTNIKGNFTKNKKTGLEDYYGWWNSVAGADIDNDGDIDFVCGNMGNNGFLNPTKAFPIKAFGKDFDGNGSFDAIFSSFLPASINDKSKREFPVAGRDDFIREISVSKEKFINYNTYANIELKNIFTASQLKGSTQVMCNAPATCWIENDGSGNFALHLLPKEAQWAPIYGIVINDFNADGNLDILLNGNEFSMAPQLGQYDGLNGLLLKGIGRGQFTALSPIQSGIFIPGNGKAIVELVNNKKPCVIATQNRGETLSFQLGDTNRHLFKPNTDDISAIISFTNGNKRKVEFYNGSSFQSQSAAYVILVNSIKSLEITNRSQQKRLIENFNK